MALGTCVSYQGDSGLFEKGCPREDLGRGEENSFLFLDLGLSGFEESSHT